LKVREIIQILVCKICDILTGFEVREVQQIRRKNKKDSGRIKKTHFFLGEKMPYYSIFELFGCEGKDEGIFIILDSNGQKFAISVSAVLDILSIENDIPLDSDGVFKSFTRQDIIKKVFVYKKIPVVVIDTRKLLLSLEKKLKEDKRK